VGRRLRGGAHAAAAYGLSHNARVHVREATSDDWERVKELLAELGRPDVRDDPDEPEHRARFEQYLARHDALALVAEHDGAIVGFVDVEFRQRLNFLQPEAWVPDLVVAEAARGTGAGRALLEEVERRAIERDTWGMALESANWRESSHAFYEHVGWSDVAKAFSRVFGDVEWPPRPR
jgi:GNAT superfamily N-acetyltransferase